MNYTCPGCSSTVSLDLSAVSTFTLQLKCPGCDTLLSLSDHTGALVDAQQANNEKQLANMIQIALADGAISRDETALLKSKARELGIDDRLLDRFVSTAAASERGPQGPVLAEVYQEQPCKYLNENDFYDWQTFAAKIARLAPDHPHLKRYREDLVMMVSANADKFKEVAKSWDRMYEKSQDSTEWDEILENKNRCLEIASALRGLREEITSKGKAEFVPYIRALASSVSTPDGW